MRTAGALVAGLGPRILRTETAGPVALALLQARYGDLGSAAVSGEVIARGATLREAFIEAVLGLFSHVGDPAAVDSREVREVRAHGDSPEALLAHWIAECCYVHEMEGFVFGAIDVALFDVEPKVGGEPMRLYAFLHGEELDRARQQAARAIKPLAPADISIRRDAGGYEIHLMRASSM